MDCQIKFVRSILILTLFSRETLSFVDLNHPIVISDASNSGESYFSFSLSGTDANPASPSKIYIGAPNATNFGSRNRNVGVVWECNLNIGEGNARKPSDQINCGVWNGASTTNAKGCCSNRQSCVTENVDGMWLGGCIESDGSSLITCGHRWTSYQLSSTYNRRVNGICYLTTTSGTSATMVLEPPLHSDDQFQLQANSRDVENSLWGNAQTGFATAYDEQNRLLLVGAPGFFDWQGNAILFDLNAPRSPSCRWKDSFVTISLNSKFISANPLDYLGYSIASRSRYNGFDLKQFAVGAPRGRNGRQYLTGYVTILTAQPIQGHRHAKRWSLEPWSIEGWPLGGTQLGSYFGSVLAFADLNGDRRDDLIVGAPFYNLQEFEEGCVFIYVSGKQNPEQLCPNTDSGGRFGSAIANIGDIDYDGCEDIAIGSPGSNGGSGAVYIYFGVNEQQCPSKAAVKILAQEINNFDQLKGSPLRGFGSTLLGKVDVDGNGTPDILIGSSLSKQITIYRTRPKLDFMEPEIAFYGTNSNSQEIDKFRPNDDQFRINFCLKTKRQPKTIGELDIQVEVMADTGVTEERFRFLENDLRVFKFPMNSKSDDVDVCQRIIIKRVKELEASDNKEISFDWRLRYNNSQSYVKDLQTFTMGVGNKLSSARSNFCALCPRTTDMVFKDQRQRLPIAKDNCDSDSNPICSSKLVINSAITDQSDIRLTDEYTVGSEEIQFLTVNVRNEKETAYSPTVDLTVKSSKLELLENIHIKLINDKRCKDLQIDQGTNGLHRYECYDPLQTGKFITLKFEISLKGVPTLRSNERIEFHISAFPKRFPSQRSDSDSTPLGIKLVSDVQLTIKNFDDGQQRISSLDSTAVFLNSYVVHNLGKSPLNSVKVLFQVPVSYKGEDRDVQHVLLVLEPSPKDRMSCSTPEGFASISSSISEISESNGVVVNETGIISRRRRQTMEKIDSPEPGAKKRYLIDCHTNEWKCANVTCTIRGPFNSQNPINIKLKLAFDDRLDNKIFPMDVTNILFSTTGKAWAFDEPNYGSQNATSTSNLIFALDEVSIPAWLVFVSGIGGLVLFLLITLCLFKCGFFRRKTKESLQHLKTQAEQEEFLAKNFNLPANADTEGEGIDPADNN